MNCYKSSNYTKIFLQSKLFSRKSLNYAKIFNHQNYFEKNSEQNTFIYMGRRNYVTIPPPSTVKQLTLLGLFVGYHGLIFGLGVMATIFFYKMKNKNNICEICSKKKLLCKPICISVKEMKKNIRRLIIFINK